MIDLHSFSDELTKIALMERLVRLGATDIPGTPRLVMKHRSPEELAALQQSVNDAWDRDVSSPIRSLGDRVVKHLPGKVVRNVSNHVVNSIATDPVGMAVSNAIPIPGATLAYIAGKHGVEKLIDRVAPVPQI